MGRFISEDPIGIGGGANFYAYAAGNPVSYSDPFGLRDYNQQETVQLLQQAYQMATAGRLQGLINIYHNSRGNGPYDFGWNSSTANDTWTLCGVTMNADDFANFMAGFQGAAYDREFFWTTGMVWAEFDVKTAGVLYHLLGLTKAQNDPFDRTGFPMINAGERAGWNFHML